MRELKLWRAATAVAGTAFAITGAAGLPLMGGFFLAASVLLSAYFTLDVFAPPETPEVSDATKTATSEVVS